MKKLLIATNLVWISILLVQSCQQNQTDTYGTNGKDPVYPDKTSSYCGDTLCSSYNNGPLSGLIDFKTARLLSANYFNDEGKRLIYKNGQLSNEEDTRNIWFDFEKMKAFIRYIEGNACIAGCDKKTARFGIRVYLGKYPDSSMLESTNLPSLRGVKKIYAHHTTVFFCPTFFDPVSHKNIDFDPGTTAKNCTFTPISETHGKGYVYLGTGAEGTTGNPDNEQNHGDVAPPPIKTGAFPVTPTEN